MINFRVLKDEVFITVDEGNVTKNKTEIELAPRLSNTTVNHFFEGPIVNYELQMNDKNIVLHPFLENKTIVEISNRS